MSVPLNSSFCLQYVVKACSPIGSDRDCVGGIIATGSDLSPDLAIIGDEFLKSCTQLSVISITFESKDSLFILQGTRFMTIGKGHALVSRSQSIINSEKSALNLRYGAVHER